MPSTSRTNATSRRGSALSGTSTVTWVRPWAPVDSLTETTPSGKTAVARSRRSRGASSATGTTETPGRAATVATAASSMRFRPNMRATPGSWTTARLRGSGRGVDSLALT